MLTWQLYHFGFSPEVIDGYFIAQGYCIQVLLEEEGSILFLFPGILDFIFRADIYYSINSVCSFSDIAGSWKKLFIIRGRVGNEAGCVFFSGRVVQNFEKV